MTRRLLLLTLVAMLASPSVAAAAPAKITPRASAVAETGVTTIEVANPNRHALRGTATVTAASRTVARRKVRLPRLAVSTVSLRFRRKALTTLRATGGRARITMRLARSGERSTVARRTLTFRLPDASPQQPGDGGQAPPPGADRYVGRIGHEGPYDDFELAVAGGRLEITRPPFVPVVCFENGGANRSALSLEIFAAAGPWTVGSDENVSRPGISGNQLVARGERPITYKVFGTAQEPGRVTGTLGMSFFDSRFDVFTNRIVFINCFGSRSFEAIVAG